MKWLIEFKMIACINVEADSFEEAENIVRDMATEEIIARSVDLEVDINEIGIAGAI